MFSLVEEERLARSPLPILSLHRVAPGCEKNVKDGASPGIYAGPCRRRAQATASILLTMRLYPTSEAVLSYVSFALDKLAVAEG